MKMLEHNFSRRRALLVGAAAVGALALGACSADQIAQAEATWATVAGQIQSAVSVAVGYIPTIESIAETAAGLFGPTYAALVTAGSALFNQIVQTLVNVVGQLSPPAQGRLRVRLRASSPAVPIVIGQTVNGVTVTGWKAN